MVFTLVVFLLSLDVNVILGLVTAYQLAKFGGVRVQIIEKHSKSSQDEYGFVRCCPNFVLDFDKLDFNTREVDVQLLCILALRKCSTS